MKRLFILAVIWVLVAARPETYKEQEEFQYSRSSSDDGSKSGYYGAQRGNMGGNYERAHNMDGYAQNQMSGVVRQVEGELGDGAKKRTGSVYSAANSRGTYGSGNIDLSNLAGRNFQEGTYYDNSHSHSSQTQSSSAHNSAGYTKSHSLSYGGYQRSTSDTQGHASDNLQSLDNSQGSNQYNYGSASNLGYRSQAGSQEHRQYNQESSNLNSGYGSSVYRVPVRIIVTPGVRRIAIPVGSPTYDVGQGSSVYNQNAFETATEVPSDSTQGVRPGDAKYYESSYRYNKKWEKHDTFPGSISVVTPTESPIPKNSELYEDSQVHTSGNQYNAREVGSQSAQSSSDFSRYNAAKSSDSQSRYQSNYNSQHRGDTSNLNRFEQSGYNAHLNRGGSSVSLDTNSQALHHTGNRYQGSAADSSFNSQADLNTQVEDLNTRPKSYQSSYSYHKSWERQGDPYVIKPASNAYYDGQSSQRLTSSTKNVGYGTYHSGSHHSQDQVDCDDNGHIRVARSYDTSNQDMQQQSQNIYDNQDLGQQVQDSWQNLEDLGQQSQSNWDQQNSESANFGQQAQNLGQQSQNTWDNLEDLSQQTQDLGQQSQNQWDKLENLGQHTQNSEQQSQNTWDKLEDLGQQTQNSEQQSQRTWDHLADFNQQTQNSEQQSQNTWDHLENFGQQSQNLGQQSQNNWDKLEDLSQQTQNSQQQSQSTWDHLENLGQQTQHSEQHSQNKWDTFEPMGQQSLTNWGKLEDVRQNNQNKNYGSHNFHQQAQNFLGGQGQDISHKLNYKPEDDDQHTQTDQSELNQMAVGSTYLQSVYKNENSDKYQPQIGSPWQGVNIGQKVDDPVPFYTYSNGFINPSIHNQYNGIQFQHENSTSTSHSNETHWTWNSHIHSNSHSEAKWEEHSASDDSYSQVSNFDSHSQQTPLSSLWGKFDNIETASGLLSKTENNFTSMTSNMENKTSSSDKHYFKETKPLDYSEIVNDKNVPVEIHSSGSEEPETPEDIGRGDIGPEHLSDKTEASHKPNKSADNIPTYQNTVTTTKTNDNSTWHNFHNDSTEKELSNDELMVLSLQQQKAHKENDFLASNEKNLTATSRNYENNSLIYKQQNIIQNSTGKHNREALENKQHNYTEYYAPQRETHIRENEDSIGQISQQSYNIEQQNSYFELQNEHLDQQYLNNFSQDNLQDFIHHNDNLDQQYLQNFDDKTVQDFKNENKSIEEQSLQNFGQEDVMSDKSFGKQTEHLDIGQKRDQNVELNDKDGDKQIFLTHIYNNSHDLRQKNKSLLLQPHERHNEQGFSDKNENIQQQHLFQQEYEQQNVNINQETVNNAMSNLEQDIPYFQQNYEQDYGNEQVQSQNLQDYDQLNQQHLQREDIHDFGIQNDNMKNFEQRESLQNIAPPQFQPMIEQKQYIIEESSLHNDTEIENKVSPAETATQKPGFWQSVGKKFTNAKDKVVSWFKS